MSFETPGDYKVVDTALPWEMAAKKAGGAHTCRRQKNGLRPSPMETWLQSVSVSSCQGKDIISECVMIAHQLCPRRQENSIAVLVLACTLHPTSWNQPLFSLGSAESNVHIKK